MCVTYVHMYRQSTFACTNTEDPYAVTPSIVLGSHFSFVCIILLGICISKIK